MGVVQSVRLEIRFNPDVPRWVDTGLILQDGEQLRVRAEGQIQVQGNGRFFYAYPEGIYSTGLAAHPAFGPEPTLQVGDLVAINEGNIAQYNAPDSKPYSLAVYIQDDPDFSLLMPREDTLQPNRDSTFLASEVGSGRVWVLSNQNNYWKKQFVGTWQLIVERVGAPPPEPDPEAPPVPQPLPVPPVAPIREGSGPEIIHEKSLVRQRTAYCWFIQPLADVAEAYTNWDVPLECPQYEDEWELEGNLTPAMTYLPFRGVDLTSIPTEIKMNIKAPDVRMVKFDREKLLRGVYEGAYIELFEIPTDGNHAHRILYVVGELGNTEVSTEEAIIELTPIEEQVNRPMGPKIQFLCDVGRLPNESFGRARCRNLVLQDGPDIEDLTRGGQVVQVLSASRYRLSSQVVSGYAGWEVGFRGSHGILRGVTGQNTGVARDIGTFTAQGVVTLRQAMPFLPVVGDEFLIEAGCDKTPEMCRLWNNQANFRGFEHLPGRAAVRRRYSRS